jgi:glycosyltransferase involved in cell wall biosynthesis
MRLLIVSNFYPPVNFGGYEIRCADVARELSRRGHVVSVLTSSLERRRVPRDPRVHRVLPRSPRGWRAARPLLFAHNAVVNRRLLRALRRLRPDVVSVWNMAGLARSLLTTLSTFGVPVTCYVEDDWLLQADPWLTAWGARSAWVARLKEPLRRLAEHATPTRAWDASAVHYVFTSHFRRAQHANAGLPVAGAQVIYGGIPLSHLPAHGYRRLRADRPPRRLLQVGAIVPAKGQDIAVEALGRLRAQGRNLELSLIGTASDPSYLAQLEARACRGGFAAALRVLPRVDREQLGRVYAEHDALVFCSRGPEGFPLSILEAMACGLPVVTTVTGGHAEVLEDGRNALLVAAAEPDRLTARLAELCDDVTQARRVAAAGQELVRGRFGISGMVDSYEAHLRSLVSPRAPGGVNRNGRSTCL